MTEQEVTSCEVCKEAGVDRSFINQRWPKECECCKKRLCDECSKSVPEGYNCQDCYDAIHG